MSRSPILRALSWSIGGRAVHLLISLSANILLMRLVAPTAFGKLALVAVAFTFLEGLRDLGTIPSMIQRKTLIRSEIAGLYSLQLLLALSCCIGPLIWYLLTKDPDLQLLLLLGTLHFLLGGIVGLPVAMWQRELRFDRIVSAEVVGLFLAAVVGIALAWWEYPIWALAIRNPLRYAYILLIVVYHRAMWWPGPMRALQLWPHLRFGGPITIDGLLNFAVRNLDDLLIGRFLGYQALGWYNRAYQILLFPIRNISRTLSRVFFPAVAPLQDDPRAVFERYEALVRLIWTTMLPCFTVLFIVADVVFPALVGEEWRSIVSVVRVFCVLAVFQLVGTLEGTIYQILGKTQLQMRLGLVIKPLLLLSIVLSLLIGKSIFWVAVGYAIASVTAVLIGLGLISKLCGVSVLRIGRACWPGIESTLIGLLLFGIFYLLTDQLIAATGIYAMSYFAYFRWRFARWYSDWLRLFRQMRSLKAH